MKFTTKSKVWLYPNMAGWHFIDVGKKLSQEIKLNDGPFRRGFGSIPVTVTIGKTSWKTSIFPDKKRGYVLPLKKQVRRQENISAGDSIIFSITIKP